jgi:hypothetical protein
MGLDAFVYCDCLEKKRLKTPHPFPKLLIILPDGSPDIRSKDPKKQEMHDHWMEKQACRHEQCMLAGEYLGNIGWIDLIWKEIEKISQRSGHQFPVLCDQVIYCGSHTGDYLSLKDVRRLEKEIAILRKRDVAKTGPTKRLKEFLSKLEKIVKASLKVGKPIAF